MNFGTGQIASLRQQRALAMTADLRRAIGMLKLTNAELQAHLARLAAQNPAIGLLSERPAGTAPARPRGGALGPGGGTDLAEALLAAPDGGLHGHVLRQIGLSFRDPVERAIAETFCAALEPSGWLRLSVAEVAAECGCPPARAEAVLARLQGFEPAGLFARSLAECLRLQAADQGFLTPRVETVLDHLELLARGAMGDLARLCRTDEDEVRAILARLRRLDPKPGARFGEAPQPARPPDLIVRPRGVGRWAVDLNRASTPQVVVREPGPDEIPDTAAREAALAEARLLARAVSRRNASTLRIAAAVVRRQGEFLRRGPAGLKPLTFAAIAAESGLHESTVSRVVAGMTIETPLGVRLLRDFFSAALPASAGESVAAGAVRHAIACLIAAEPPGAPLSDEAIARRLQAQGQPVARRTVAKYREQLRIPGSAQRRARARLDGRG